MSGSEPDTVISALRRMEHVANDVLALQKGDDRIFRDCEYLSELHSLINAGITDTLPDVPRTRLLEHVEAKHMQYDEVVGKTGISTVQFYANQARNLLRAIAELEKDHPIMRKLQKTPINTSIIAG